MKNVNIEIIAKGSISPNFVRQTKIFWQTALGEEKMPNFDA